MSEPPPIMEFNIQHPTSFAYPEKASVLFVRENGKIIGFKDFGNDASYILMFRTDPKEFNEQENAYEEICKGNDNNVLAPLAWYGRIPHEIKPGSEESLEIASEGAISANFPESTSYNYMVYLKMGQTVNEYLNEHKHSLNEYSNISIVRSLCGNLQKMQELNYYPQNLSSDYVLITNKDETILCIYNIKHIVDEAEGNNQKLLLKLSLLVIIYKIMTGSTEDDEDLKNAIKDGTILNRAGCLKSKFFGELHAKFFVTDQNAPFNIEAFNIEGVIEFISSRFTDTKSTTTTQRIEPEEAKEESKVPTLSPKKVEDPYSWVCDSEEDCQTMYASLVLRGKLNPTKKDIEDALSVKEITHLNFEEIAPLQEESKDELQTLAEYVVTHGGYLTREESKEILYQILDSITVKYKGNPRFVCKSINDETISIVSNSNGILAVSLTSGFVPETDENAEFSYTLAEELKQLRDTFLPIIAAGNPIIDRIGEMCSGHPSSKDLDALMDLIMN